MQGVWQGSLTFQVLWREHRQSVVVAEVYTVVVAVHADVGDVFFLGQSVAGDVAYEGLCALLVLPNAHRCSAPDIAVVGFNDVIDDFVLQFI